MRNATGHHHILVLLGIVMSCTTCVAIPSGMGQYGANKPRLLGLVENTMPILEAKLNTLLIQNG